MLPRMSAAGYGSALSFQQCSSFVFFLFVLLLTCILFMYVFICISCTYLLLKDKHGLFSGFKGRHYNCVGFRLTARGVFTCKHSYLQTLYISLPEVSVSRSRVKLVVMSVFNANCNIYCTSTYMCIASTQHIT